MNLHANEHKDTNSKMANDKLLLYKQQTKTKKKRNKNT